MMSEESTSSNSGSLQNPRVDWELTKENIQPLAAGRVMSHLTHSLEDAKKRNMEVNEKIKELEDDIKSYKGPDVLEPIWRLVTYCEQHCLTGSNSTYERILKKSIKMLVNDVRYMNDRRFIDMLCKTMRHESREKRIQVYESVMSRGIGKSDSRLFIELSENYKEQHNLQKAIQIIKDGIAADAQPIQYLHETLIHLENLVIKELADKMNSLNCEDARNFGASVPKIGEEAVSDRRGLPLAEPISKIGKANKEKNASAKKFTIFQEENGENVTPPENRIEGKIEINFGRTREVENDLRTEKWTTKDSALPFIVSNKEEPVPIKIYEEPSTSQEKIAPVPEYPKPLRLSVHPLSERKVGKEEPEIIGGFIQKSMYNQDLVFRNGKEFSFEERRAEIYERKRLAKEKAEAVKTVEMASKEADNAEKEREEKEKTAREQADKELKESEEAEREKKINFQRGSRTTQANHEKVQLESEIQKLNNLLQRSNEEKSVADGKVTKLGETVELLKSEKDEILKKLNSLEFENDQLRADQDEKTRLASQLTEENQKLVEKNEEVSKALEKAEFESETAILERDSLQLEIESLQHELKNEKQERLALQFKLDQMKLSQQGEEKSIYESATKSFVPHRRPCAESAGSMMEMATMNTTRFSPADMPSSLDIEITGAVSTIPDMTRNSDFGTSKNFLEPSVPIYPVYARNSYSYGPSINIEGAPGQTGPVRKLAFNLYESRVEQSKLKEAIEKSLEEEPDEDQALDFRYASLSAAANKENVFPHFETNKEEDEDKENCFNYVEEKPKRRLSGILLPSTDAEYQELVYEDYDDEEILGQCNKTGENFNVSNLTRALTLNPRPVINSTPQRTFPTRSSLPASAPGFKYQDPHVNSMMNYQQHEKPNFTNPLYFQGNNLSMIQETSKEAYTTTGSSSSNLTRGSTASSVFFPRSAPRSEGRHYHPN